MATARPEALGRLSEREPMLGSACEMGEPIPGRVSPEVTGVAKDNMA